MKWRGSGEEGGMAGHTSPCPLSLHENVPPSRNPQANTVYLSQVSSLLMCCRGERRRQKQLLKKVRVCTALSTRGGDVAVTRRVLNRPYTALWRILQGGRRGDLGEGSITFTLPSKFRPPNSPSSNPHDLNLSFPFPGLGLFVLYHHAHSVFALFALCHGVTTRNTFGACEN